MTRYRPMVLTGVIDEARVAVIGGSHGGFLTGNLVGQHPGRFRCGVLRNPVMDLGLMVHVSDIPDWVYVEAWGTQARCPLPVSLHPETLVRWSILVIHAGWPQCFIHSAWAPGQAKCPHGSGLHTRPPADVREHVPHACFL